MKRKFLFVGVCLTVLTIVVFIEWAGKGGRGGLTSADESKPVIVSTLPKTNVPATRK